MQLTDEPDEIDEVVCLDVVFAEKNEEDLNRGSENQQPKQPDRQKTRYEHRENGEKRRRSGFCGPELSFPILVGILACCAVETEISEEGDQVLRESIPEKFRDEFVHDQNHVVWELVGSVVHLRRSW